MQSLAGHPSLQERAYGSLRASIVGGRLKPGERLLEPVVAHELGISRSPVREAIRRLQQDGFVMIRPRLGAFVALVTQEEVDDIYRIRGALEGVAAALAAERRTDRDLRRMSEVLERMSLNADSGDEDDVVDAADRFHQSIYDAAKSPRLSALLESIHHRVAQFRNLSLRVPGRAHEAAVGHRQLLDAIGVGDIEAAETLMRSHIEGARVSISASMHDASHP